MKPIGRGELKKEIGSATVIFFDKKERHLLAVKSNSSCHFFDRFCVGKDEVQLRLDWSDIDENGYPVLDADFYDIKTKKKKKLKGSRLRSHHTNSIDGRGRMYSWEFNGYTRPFKVQVVWLLKGSCNASATATGSAVVIKATKNSAYEES